MTTGPSTTEVRRRQNRPKVSNLIGRKIQAPQTDTRQARGAWGGEVEAGQPADRTTSLDRQVDHIASIHQARNQNKRATLRSRSATQRAAQSCHVLAHEMKQTKRNREHRTRDLLSRRYLPPLGALRVHRKESHTSPRVTARPRRWRRNKKLKDHESGVSVTNVNSSD